MPSKRSREHARRPTVRRVAASLCADNAPVPDNPIFRIVDRRMRSAYMTLGAHFAISTYPAPSPADSNLSGLASLL